MDGLIDMIYITAYIYFWIIQFLIMIKNKFYLSRPYVTFADPGIFVTFADPGIFVSFADPGIFAFIFLLMCLIWFACSNFIYFFILFFFYYR